MEVKREHAEERAEVHSRSAPDLAERLMSASASGGAELGEKAQRTNTGADMPWAQGCAGLGPSPSARPPEHRRLALRHIEY